MRQWVCFQFIPTKSIGYPPIHIILFDPHEAGRPCFIAYWRTQKGRRESSHSSNILFLDGQFPNFTDFLFLRSKYVP